MNIGHRIRKIREIKGFKQETLAKMLDITQQRLSQIENTSEIDEKLLFKISEALNITPDAIKNFRDDLAINNFNNFTQNGQCINYQIVMTDKLIDV